MDAKCAILLIKKKLFIYTQDLGINPKIPKIKYSDKQLKEHYEIEKELAKKLRNSDKDERKLLYSTLYNELFKKILYHPLLFRKKNPEFRKRVILYEMKFLKFLLRESYSFLEIGPGDCMLSLEVAKFVKNVNAVDVSKEITKNIKTPSNFKLIISDGTSIPIPKSSINLAYSNSLIEHLHPDDAKEHIINVYNILKPNGIYLCITPNRLSGPHDISRNFDIIATGFHLKEYTVYELSNLFYNAGYSKVYIMLNLRIKIILLKIFPIVLIERILEILPPSLMRKITFSPIKYLLGVCLIGIK